MFEVVEPVGMRTRAVQLAHESQPRTLTEPVYSYADVERGRRARVARVCPCPGGYISLREMARWLGCTARELSDVERGALCPADRIAFFARLGSHPAIVRHPAAPEEASQ